MQTFIVDATDFTDIDVKPHPSTRFTSIATDDPNYREPCPKCLGHGGWNLTLNAYGDKRHFQASCGQCNGYGWVGERDATCIHNYKEINLERCRELGVKHFGKCWHVYECQKGCGRISAVDSSD